MTSTALPQKFSHLRNKKLLVTGAAGFIGGHLFQRLNDYGLNVTGTVLYPEEAAELRAQGYSADVLDLASDESWDNLLRGVDIVFNVAAMFQESEHGEAAYDKVNNRGALKLAQTAARKGVSRFVHCSTVGVHGSVKEIPATEQTPYNPMDEYHRTKLAGELAVLEFGRCLGEDGMVITVNRPAMVYGPGDMRMLKLFKMILSGKFRMIGTGRVWAHLGYIEDQTESFVLCAVAPREKVHGQAFNIASDKPLTLNELVALIAECGGVKLSSMHVPVGPLWLAGIICERLCQPFGIRPPLSRRRIGFFTHDRAFDLTKAKHCLGYESRWDNRAGITQTIKWYREQGLV